MQRILFIVVAMFLGGCSIFSAQPIARNDEIRAITNTVSVTSTPVQRSKPEPAIAGQTEQGRAVAARVNNVPIWLDTLNQKVDALKQSERHFSDESAANLKLLVLNRLIDAQILAQSAEALGIRVTDAELETASQTLKTEFSDQFEPWLKANSMTPQQFTKSLEQELIANKLFEHLMINAPPNADQVTVFFLWVDNQSLADAVSEKLRQGKSFTQLIQEEQAYNPTNTGGGFFDWFPIGLGVLPDRVERVAFNTTPGAVEGPLFISPRYYFVQLEDKASNKPLSEEWLQRRNQHTFETWLANQRNKSSIEIFIATK